MRKRMELRHALDELERLQQQLAHAIDDDFEDHRRDVVSMRRSMAEMHAALYELANEAFEEGEQLAAFRRHYLQMRTAVAQHQSAWSVVAIEPNDPEYLRTLRPMRDANRHFIAWMREALASE